MGRKESNQTNKNIIVLIKEAQKVFDRIRSFLSIHYVHGDLCKPLGIDSSTDHPDRYSNLFLNAYINRHAHADHLKMI